MGENRIAFLNGSTGDQGGMHQWDQVRLVGLQLATDVCAVAEG